MTLYPEPCSQEDSNPPRMTFERAIRSAKLARWPKPVPPQSWFEKRTMAPCPKRYSKKASSHPQMEFERAIRSPNQTCNKTETGPSSHIDGIRSTTLTEQIACKGKLKLSSNCVRGKAETRPSPNVVRTKTMAPCPKPYSNKGSSPPQMELERATRSPNCARANPDQVPPRMLVETISKTPCTTPCSRKPSDPRTIPAKSYTVEEHVQIHQFHTKS
jgi:hypothetical protein